MSKSEHVKSFVDQLSTINNWSDLKPYTSYYSLSGPASCFSELGNPCVKGEVTVGRYKLYCSKTQVASSWNLYLDGKSLDITLGFLNGLKVKRALVLLSMKVQGYKPSFTSGREYELIMFGVMSTFIFMAASMGAK